MPTRRLPVRPNLDQLKHQAKDLLRAVRAGDPGARADFVELHPQCPSPADARLADAQLVLARSYQATSWPRLVLTCKLVDAIWHDRAESVRALILQYPQLLREPVLIRDSNWGAPLTYAANLGRDRIIEVLRSLGADDLQPALGRALLQGQTQTARRLHELLGKPPLPADALCGPAYTLNVAGTMLALDLGATVCNEHGQRSAPLDVVLESDNRQPDAKHAILESYVRHGLALPDTPTMALHRGRIDLLEQHLQRDPQLLVRQFSHEEIYPPALGCHDAVLATHGTPLAGATLLHMCVDYDELAIATWLLDRGMDVDARAALDADGFGGHTALFATVVTQPNFWMNHNDGVRDAPFTRLLLERGADPNARASLRKQLHPGYGPDMLHEYRDVTPLAWGRRFHRQIFVSEPAMQLIVERDGRE